MESTFEAVVVVVELIEPSREASELFVAVGRKARELQIVMNEWSFVYENKVN
jgi:hypothetical protein